MVDFITLAKKFPVLLRPVQFLQKRLRNHTLGEERWSELSSLASVKLALTTANATAIDDDAAAATSASATHSTANDNTSLQSSLRGGSDNTSISISTSTSTTDLSKKGQPVGAKVNDTAQGQGLGTAQGQGLGTVQGQGLGTVQGKILAGSKTGDTLVVRSISR